MESRAVAGAVSYSAEKGYRVSNNYCRFEDTKIQGTPLRRSLRSTLKNLRLREACSQKKEVALTEKAGGILAESFFWALDYDQIFRVMKHTCSIPLKFKALILMKLETRGCPIATFYTGTKMQG